ncbi:MAG: excinuclease ABC subunit UvrA [Bdellovibrionales bacterium]|nr:excinuclease ABC subunit UvrA [Bdellovibrionales bacterium]
MSGLPITEKASGSAGSKKRSSQKVSTSKSKSGDGVFVHGAREHNLKNISTFIPRNKITVITGLSGSGKSSLAFDTIYAEGQRRYVESLSAYARNFLEQMKKPDVDAIVGLSPAIAIDQKSISTNPRSTVGTVTEIYDYLRLLYARVGVPYCPDHHLPVTSQSPEQIISDIKTLKAGTKFFIFAPMVKGKKGEFLAEFQKWVKKGFAKAKVDGEWVELAQAKKLAKHKTHDIDLLIDRLVMKEDIDIRLKESVNLAITMSQGQVAIAEMGKEPKTYSIHSSCPECGMSFPELEPRLFSFNNPRGACETCHGLGSVELTEDLVVDSDEEVIVDDYAIEVCPDCKGTRLRKEARNVFLDGYTITELAIQPANQLFHFLDTLKLDERRQLIGEKILKQIQGRLSYLSRVGCGYLSLDRPTRTLSGGEAQRIRLASQVGSALVGILYVLDEPSIGLHPRDHARLLTILEEIRDRGNTILMVEHDEDTMRGADHLIDLGPRAGRLGGELLAEGTPQEVAQNSKSLTGSYLSGKIKIPVPKSRRSGNGDVLIVKGARGNNLKNVDLKIPLGTFCGVTGVSGSGKSTLVVDTLYRILAEKMNRSTLVPAEYKEIQGLDKIDKVIEINQKPIGRTPRSVPSTYVQVFPMIRDLYASLPEAKMRGFKPGHFSFNVKGGRCEACQGNGMIRVEMHFLSDVFVQCETCMGRRYSREILNIRFKEKSIADVLEMTVEEATEFFQNQPRIHKKLKTLNQVGLDYIHLGQSSTTLSGGEAQRVKLARELSKRGTGKTLYILDEPTTGLHFDDVAKLIHLLESLVEQGNTVLVIEHHLDVIKSCDHLIELGPDGGEFGGEIVFTGTPEQMAMDQTETSQYIHQILDKKP